MKTGTMLAALLAAYSMLAGSSALAETDDAEAPAAEAAVEPEAKTFVSEHEIEVDGQRIRYTATAGTLLLHDGEGKPVAEFGYTSYLKKGTNPSTRPIMFAWNGGPGSASMWLHMGVLGPQMVVVEDLQADFRPRVPA